MHKHNISTIFITALCTLTFYSNLLFSSDPVHAVLFNHDHNQHIFEHGTEKSNEELRCTCKTLNAAGAVYHAKQASIFNKEYKSADCITLFGSRTAPVPGFIILPGGKQCSVPRYTVHFEPEPRSTFELSEFLEETFTLTALPF